MRFKKGWRYREENTHTLVAAVKKDEQRVEKKVKAVETDISLSMDIWSIKEKGARIFDLVSNNRK